MSEADLAAVWARSLDELAEMHIEPAQRAWLQLTRPLGLVENTALIATPNEFVKEQLETRLRSLITNALSRELGRSIQLAVTVDPAVISSLPVPGPGPRSGPRARPRRPRPAPARPARRQTRPAAAWPRPARPPRPGPPDAALQRGRGLGAGGTSLARRTQQRRHRPGHRPAAPDVHPRPARPGHGLGPRPRPGRLGTGPATAAGSGLGPQGGLAGAPAPARPG